MSVRLYSQGLLSKWGFSDGDLLDDWCYDLEDRGGPTIHGQKLLVALVKEYLLPALTNEVEMFEIQTIHNPIRALRVDGIEIDNYAMTWPVELVPAFVDIPEESVLAMAEKLSHGEVGE